MCKNLNCSLASIFLTGFCVRPPTSSLVDCSLLEWSGRVGEACLPGGFGIAFFGGGDFHNILTSANEGEICVMRLKNIYSA